MKYRIVEKTYGDGSKWFFVQRRFLFFWYNIRDRRDTDHLAAFLTLDAAKHYVIFDNEYWDSIRVQIENSKVKSRVIHRV